MSNPESLILDPFNFLTLCWPDIRLYDKQAEIVESVRDNDETIVPAGNQLGKDFITAFIALWFFCSRSPCRVVTSSVDQPQLKGVLWGELRRFIQTSKYPLPIQVNDMLIRQVKKDGELDPLSYLIGRVTQKGEGLLGHHIARTSKGDVARTLAIFDECSGIDDESYEATDTWAHKKLAIGNPFPCTNFFFRGVTEGDLPRPKGKGYYRKVIKIKAEDSPNVKLGVKEKNAGLEPSGNILLPGVKDYDTYQKHRQLWDPIKQCISLDAEFYKGAEVLLYPPSWLNLAETLAASLPKVRRGTAIGVDPAEGGDSTVWTVVDDRGIIEQQSQKTHDTSVIANTTAALIKKYNVPETCVMFDRGGGGKQHADFMRTKGFKVGTVGFGESATDPNSMKRRMRTFQEKTDAKEHSYVYKNRRAEMYGLLRNLLDPTLNPKGFGIPAELKELRRQLSPLPLLFDAEGRMYLPPKDKRSPNSKEETIKDMLGCSPDEADSLVLAIYGLINKPTRVIAGATMI